MCSFKNLGMDHVYQHSIMHRVTSLTLRNVNKNDLVESLVLLRRNGTPPLFDVLPFEINNENYFLLIDFICTIFDNVPRSSVG